MKKYVWIFVLALGCFCISCTSKPQGGLSAKAQKNLDANDSINHCFETGDFSKLGDYIAADAVDHGGEHGDIKGIDSLKAEFERYTASVSNQKSEIIKALADDDYVMSWTHFTGTYKTDGPGHKAGDSYDMKMMDVSKFKDGKGTEHWIFMDPADMMKMMGPQQSAMPMSADSAKRKMKM